MFDGTRPNAKDDKISVALAVNEQQPTRVLYVRYPYDVYTLYNEVPSTHWTPIQYVSPVLTLNAEKLPEGLVNHGRPTGGPIEKKTEIFVGFQAKGARYLEGL
ncbi:hypothetical protein TNCV_3373981 [Trichonephila clavipes]|nr:hypothetical protein TNCV_3373981 [Trichonephila clavipes]